MPAAGFLTDEQVAGVMTYIRREWDHEGSPVTPEFVAKVRLANARRADAWTAPELGRKE
jgi:mono/diheme cytochrome c family protein